MEFTWFSTNSFSFSILAIRSEVSSLKCIFQCFMGYLSSHVHIVTFCKTNKNSWTKRKSQNCRFHTLLFFVLHWKGMVTTVVRVNNLYFSLLPTQSYHMASGVLELHEPLWWRIYGTLVAWNPLVTIHFHYTVWNTVTWRFFKTFPVLFHRRN